MAKRSRKEKSAADILAKLKLLSVNLRASTVRLSPTFEPRYNGGPAFRTQTKHLINRCDLFVIGAEGAPDKTILRAILDVGVRWALAQPESETAQSTEKKKPKSGFSELGRIEASFVVEYEVTGDGKIGEDEVVKWAAIVPSMHTWPYWQEFVASMCCRLSIKKLEISAFSFPKNADQIAEIRMNQIKPT